METRHCLECGLPIPAAEIGERCPHCLLRLALGETAGLPPSRPRYFAGYELLDELGHGGMGVVWKARQLSVNRLVALKMIPAGQLASPQARLRFRIETEAVAQLDHPHIVSLHETGEHDGQHYFSMKLVEGGNLSGLIAAHRAEMSDGAWLRRAARLVSTIARAVHHAHQRGILHRDLKPSNILIDARGEPHVADFGLAKVLGRDSGVTHSESVLGSPNYMAAEQASGRGAEVTIAADVYSLGAILYELFTGRPPFEAATAVETMRRVVDGEAAPPRQLNTAVDADLETICLKCLRKEPASRYGSAEELAADLDRWLDGKPIQARPVRRIEQLYRWCRRQPALASALAISVVLLAALIVGTAVAAVRIARAERNAAAHLRESLLGQARMMRLNAKMGMRKEALAIIHRAASLGGPPEFRRRARDELLATLVRTDVNFVPQPKLICSPDPALNLMSPRGDRLAVTTNSGTVLIIGMADARPLARFDVDGLAVLGLESFSSDGRYLAVRQADRASIWDTVTGLNVFSTNDPTCSLCFVPDKPQAVIQTDRKVASIYDLGSRQIVRTINPYPKTATAASWSYLALSPDGQTLAAARNNSRIVEIVDIESGKLSRNLTNAGRALTLAWSGDGARIAVTTTARRISLWAKSGAQIYVSNPLPAALGAIALDQRGSLIAAGGEDRLIRIFDVEAELLAFELPCEIGQLAFDPEGVRIGPVFRNAVAGFLHMARPDEFSETAVTAPAVSLAGCLFSSDGRIVAVGTPTNVLLCASANGEVFMDNFGWNIRATCFDPYEPTVLAAGTPGLFRWNLQRNSAGGLELANERRVFAGRGWRSFTYGFGGQWFAAANVHSNAAFVFDGTFTNKCAEVGPHPDVEFVAISPEGRWVATGSATDRRLRIWETNKGQVLELGAGVRPRGAFSPDGKWFAAFGEAFELWRVGSWQLVRPMFQDGEREPLLGAAAFSPDQRILAVVADLSSVQLLDLLTLQSIGALQLPGPGEINALAFSPDGGRLAAVGRAGRLRIWDLHALRQRLGQFGLGWELAASAEK